jgi:hypothetical protein
MSRQEVNAINPIYIFMPTDWSLEILNILCYKEIRVLDYLRQSCQTGGPRAAGLFRPAAIF